MKISSVAKKKKVLCSEWRSCCELFLFLFLKLNHDINSLREIKRKYIMREQEHWKTGLSSSHTFSLSKFFAFFFFFFFFFFEKIVLCYFGKKMCNLISSWSCETKNCRPIGTHGQLRDNFFRALYLYHINVELTILCYNFQKLLMLLCRPVLMSMFMIMSMLLRLRAWFIFKVYLYSYTNEVIIKMAKKLWTYGLQSIP